MIDSASFCVYEHVVAGKVIYIGSGTPGRPFEKRGRSEQWKDATRDGYSIKVVEWFQDREAAYKAERRRIAKVRPTANLAGWSPPHPTFDEAVAAKGYSQYFEFLGHNGSVYYYWNKRFQWLERIHLSRHSKLRMIQLAPLEFWNLCFSKWTRDRWQVLSWLLERQRQVGFYEPPQKTKAAV